MIREGKKLPADVMSRIPKLVNQVAADKQITALYAFGGLAADRLKPLSDLDFAVLLTTNLTRKQRFEKQTVLINEFTSTLATEEMDLVVLNDAPVRFSHQVIKSGKLLYCEDHHALGDHIEKTIKTYLDFIVFRHEFEQINLHDARDHVYGIKEHLNLLNQYHLHLAEIGKTPKSQFFKDDLVRAATERYLQLAIESCLNIGNRLISLYQFKSPVKTPETYADIFTEMLNLGVIDTEFSNRLVKMTKFRNRLVHLYWALEPEMVYQIVRQNLDDFKLFEKKVVDYLSDHPLSSGRKEKNHQNET